MKKLLLPIIILGTTINLCAQVGVNTTNPQTTFDIVGVPATATAADGLIAPRLTRAQLIAKTAYGSNQQGAIVYVTDNSGTVTSSTLKVTGAGYYYFDGTIWQSIGGTIPTEPWNIQGGTTSATANNQNIYQSGAVAINKQTGITGADLDVAGAIRGGAANTAAAVGVNSIVVGENSTAQYESSATFGKNNVNNGRYAIVAGIANTVTKTDYMASAVFGDFNTVNHQLSLVAGYGNKLLNGGGTNFVLGDQNTIDGNYSWNAVFGRENTNIKGNKALVAGERNSISNDFEVALGNQNFTFPNAALTVGKGSGSNSFAIANSAGNNLVAINSGNVAPAALSPATKLKVYGDTEITTKLGVGPLASAPAATVEITGTPATATVPDGVIAPRITRAQLIAKTAYTAAQTGAILYVTDASGTTNTATAKVTGAGYYYFDGAAWQSMVATSTGASNGLTLTAGNIELGGTVTKPTTVSAGANALTISTTTAGGIKVTSDGTAATPKSALQVVDGGQASGKALISDGSGNASWKDIQVNAISGTFPSSGVTLTGNSAYTGASISLPPGKWMINLGSTVTAGTTIFANGASNWITFTVQDGNSGSTEATTSDYINNYSGIRAGAGYIGTGSFKTFVSGAFAVNNSSTASKTYFIWINQEKYGSAANAGGAFSSSGWERYLYATPIK